MIAVDLIIAVPLFVGVVLLAAGRRLDPAARWIALVCAALQLGLVGYAIAQAQTGARVTGVLGVTAELPWRFVADGLSLPLVLLTALTSLLAVAAAWKVDRRPSTLFGLLTLLGGCMAAVFLADSLVLFYIAWESVLVPMFLLIGGWGSAGGRRAATKFLVFTFAGGAVLLAGVILALVSGGSDSISAVSSSGGAGAGGTLLFWLLALGFLVKVPAVPLHTWLPDAHTEAPTAGSIVLAGVLLKMGGYGLIRVALPFAPAGFAAAQPVLAGLGIVGIVWGAATALVQTDLKRLVAYSSVAHMGFVILAVSTASAAALGAAVLTMFSHGLVAGLLFFLVGAVYEHTHTRELSAYGGLGGLAPRWAVAFVFACLASAGLPGLSGFPGEYVTLVESFGPWSWWVAVAALGVVLAAAYNLRAVRETVQGPAERVQSVPDLDGRQSLAAGLVALGIVVVGVAPWLITTMAEPVLLSVQLLLGQVGS